MATSIYEARLLASEQSLGRSNAQIHDAVARAMAHADAHGPWLDYGSGRGDFIRRLHREGHRKLSAIDIGPRPEDLDSAIEYVQADLNERTPLSNDRFGTVAAIEVIEHLENPRGVAREWFRILSPGGLLVASTPNNESVRSLLSIVLRGYYVAFGPRDYPAHITPLLRIDIERILREAGFVDIRIEPTGHGSLPIATSMTWQQLAIGRRRWPGPLPSTRPALLSDIRFSDNIVISARKP